MNKKTFLFIVCVIILTIALFIEVRIKRKALPSINLSALVLNDMNGNEITLSNFKKKPLVVNFWGTWCGPCLEELAEFETVQKNYAGQVNFIMVSDEPAEKIKTFQQNNNYSFLFVRSIKPFDNFGISSVPVTNLYDGTGNLFTTKNGALTKEELNQLIQEIIKAE